MREIKFRGKSIKNGNWVYGYFDKSIANKYYIHETKEYKKSFFLSKVFEVIPESVGQYIQRLNGYEIYVGDIVQAYKYGDKETRPYLYEITYRNGTYWFGSWTWIEFLQTFRCVEVIDYFRENPKVREVQNE